MHGLAIDKIIHSFPQLLKVVIKYHTNQTKHWLDHYGKSPTQWCRLTPTPEESHAHTHRDTHAHRLTLASRHRYTKRSPECPAWLCDPGVCQGSLPSSPLHYLKQAQGWSAHTHTHTQYLQHLLHHCFTWPSVGRVSSADKRCCLQTDGQTNTRAARPPRFQGDSNTQPLS